ncbi:MAG: TRAP transporter small permease subunit [Deltaproteobacteria bacterium]|nr:TRAP transporter small permease subunit [Deltaproteobacteria bacterium]
MLTIRRVYRTVSVTILTWTMAVLFLAIVAQNLTRILGRPGFAWTTELVQASLVWMTGAGLGLIALEGRLLRLSLLPAALTEKVTGFISMVLGLFLVCASALMTARTWEQTTPVLDLPMGLHFIPFAWGGLGLVLARLACGPDKSAPRTT